VVPFREGLTCWDLYSPPRDDTPVLPVDPSVQGVISVAAVPTVGATGQDVFSGELEFDFAFRSDAESVGHGFDWTERLNGVLVPVRLFQFVLPKKYHSCLDFGCRLRILTATSTFSRGKRRRLQRRLLSVLFV
jgi:hypothetical protein